MDINTTTIKTSGAPDGFEDESVIIDGKFGTCRKCGRYLGTVEGRNLHCGEVILVSHAPIRCRSCNTRHKWKPIVK